MELEKAKAIADQVIKRLSPYCSRIEVAGSIRRQKAFPHDIDIVLIPSDLWNLEHEIRGLARPFAPKLSGEKLKGGEGEQGTGDNSSIQDSQNQ